MPIRRPLGAKTAKIRTVRTQADHVIDSCKIKTESTFEGECFKLVRFVIICVDYLPFASAIN